MIKSFLIKSFKFFFKPPKYRLKIFFLDFFGINLFRILFYKISFKLRGIILKKKLAKIFKKYKNPISLMDRDGILKIEKYFPDKTFKKIEKILKKIFSEMQYLEFRSGGKIKTLSINGDESSNDRRFIYDIFVKDKYLKEMIIFKQRTLFYWKPRVVIQEIFIPKNCSDKNDTLHVLHTDRFFNHIKLFFYINPQNSKNGAYVYAKKSHKINTFYRYLHEYESAFRASKNLLMNILGLKADKYHLKSYDSISPYFRNKLKLKEESISGEKNTLVLTDNCGFHSRGVMKSGTKRIQIRIQFQYLEIGILRTIFLFLFQKINKNFLKITNDGI